MGAAKRPKRAREMSLGVPAGLTAETFRVGPDEYALFAVPLPSWSLPDGLGAAEAEIASRLLCGESAARIARARNRSVNTVRNQIRALYVKLDVSSRAELAAVCGGRRASRDGSP